MMVAKTSYSEGIYQPFKTMLKPYLLPLSTSPQVLVFYVFTFNLATIYPFVLEVQYSKYLINTLTKFSNIVCNDLDLLAIYIFIKY